MKVLNQDLIQNYNGETFNVQHQNDTVFLTFTNGDYLEDHVDYINAFSRGLKDKSYDSILIGGLGLGIMPQWVKTFTSCSLIDVVENNTELVSWVSSSNYLDSNINLVEDNILEHTPSSSYDFIVVDIWWSIPENYDILKQTLITNLSGSLNPSGSIYLPVAADFYSN